MCRKPKLVVKHKLITPTLAAAFSMCAEGEGNDEAQQERYEQEETLSPYIFGSQVIDTLALSLPVNHVIGPALSFVGQYGLPEMHFRQRRAAITAITVLTEGCSQAIKDTLGMFGRVCFGFAFGLLWVWFGFDLVTPTEQYYRSGRTVRRWGTC